MIVVTISVAGAVSGRTFVIIDTENPVWMQHFRVPVAHYAALQKCTLWLKSVMLWAQRLWGLLESRKSRQSQGIESRVLFRYSMKVGGCFEPVH